jgi:serine/threonine protein phosphatase 1
MQLVQRFERNTTGRDFAVGDIHGHFSKLQSALDIVGFDPAADRLFSVGDLVDRGPESVEALRWLALPWFHAVRGNHEDVAMRHVKIGKVDTVNYADNGGAWFLALGRDRQVEFAAAFEALPLAMEVVTEAGPVGLLHADCPVGDWSHLEAKLTKHRSVRERAMWSRTRIESDDTSGVKGVYAVMVGHTPVREPVVLGNVFHIDTKGWKASGYFTVVDLSTLKPGEPLPVLDSAISLTGRLMAALRGMAGVEPSGR